MAILGRGIPIPVIYIRAAGVGGVFVVGNAKEAAITATQNASLTFDTPPLEDDIVIMWPGSTTTAGVNDIADWVNVLGVSVDVESAANQLCCLYHIVTAAEESASTVTFTAALLYTALETGNVVGCVVRGVDVADPLGGTGSTFDSGAITPHVLAAVTPDVTGGLVLSCVAKDASGTYTLPVGWSELVTSASSQARWLGRFDTLTTSTVAVGPTNITPSTADDYVSITVVMNPLPAGGGTQLVVQNATHAHTVDNVALTQHQVLVVADATHSHTAANVALTQHQVLTVADATHAHSAEATVLVQHQVLAVAAATHAHSAANVVLTQHQVLAVADSTHGHSAANVTLGVGVVTLVVADTVHGHTVEAVTLTQHQALTVAAATHGHTAAAVALTQHHVLTVAAATHGHSAANVTLGVAGVLDVHPATHGHTAAAVALTQHQVLTVANATHGHSAANVTLTVGVVTLTVAAATHGHTAAAVVLTQHHVLVVAGTVHAHSVGAVALTQHQVLAVDNALHAHLAAVVVFNVLVLVGPLTTGTVRHPRTTSLEAHARTTGTVRHPRTTEAP